MSRDDRTLRIALSEFEMQRLADLAAAMETSPTVLAREGLVHVLDQLAEQQMGE